MMRLVMVAAVLAVVAAFAMAPETEARRKQEPECPKGQIMLVREAGGRCGITLYGFVPRNTTIEIYAHGVGTPVFRREVSFGYAITNLPDDTRHSICFYGPRLGERQTHIMDRQIKRGTNECEGAVWATATYPPGDTPVVPAKTLIVLPSR